MKKTVVTVAVALAAFAVRAGWEDWQADLYSASFEDYAVDERLNGLKGTDGGIWGDPNIPASINAVAQRGSDGEMYMECATGEKLLFFSPYDAGYRYLKTVATRVRLPAYDADAMPDIPVGARAAFALCTYEDGVGFIGLETKANSGSWVRLFGSSVQPSAGAAWYDVSMKFVKKDDSIRVQYRVKTESGVYEPLQTEDGTSWLEAAGDPEREIASKVAFHGEGGVKYLAGSEPKRGLLLGLVPFRAILVDETVYRHGTGDWAAFDPASGTWMDTPIILGDAYAIDVADGTDGNAFIPKNRESDALKVVEFAVRFTAPNENDALPDDVNAVVRIVEEPLTDLTNPDATYRFACLVKDGWYTNTQFYAEVDTDYTLEISQNETDGKVAYRIRRGRGGEGSAYQPLLPAPAEMPVISPFYAFFGGHGLVYEIKSKATTEQ